MQAVRRSVPGRRYRTRRLVQLLLLLDPQLPKISRRLLGLGRADCRCAGRPRLPSASMWQSLGFGPNYKSAYCMAVCPAGEDVIGPYLQDKQRHLKEDRKSTRLNSSHMSISYAVFCLKKKKNRE